MRSAVIAALLFATACPAVAQTTRPVVPYVASGKQATALIVVGEGSASAFCVDASGLFVTNNHVVKRMPAGREVKLILRPGGAEESAVTGTVLRTDDKNDLALMRVKTDLPLTALPLGSDTNLIETMEVVAFGYPFGKFLATKGNNPNITVSVGRITSLRRTDGKLTKLQLDNSLNPGNSGGPLLDGDGKVVGVVQGGIPGAATNFAIPVSIVADFLAKPEIEFTAPAITGANRNTNVNLAVRLISPLRPVGDYTVQITINGVGEQRKVKLELANDVFASRFVPVPPREGPLEVCLAVRFPQDFLTCRAKDGPLTIAGKTVKLSEVARVESGTAGKTTLADGSVIQGQFESPTIPVLIGSQAVALDVSKASSVEVRVPPEPTSLTFQVEAMLNGRLVNELTARGDISGPASTQPVAAGANGEWGAPTSIAGEIERKLPDSIQDVIGAAAGRYLILHLAKTRKLAVLETSSGEIVKYLPVDSDTALIAAGMEKLFVILPDKHVVQRYGLGTWERELVATLDGDASAMAMGHSSNGPIIVAGAGRPGGLHTLDPVSLRLAPLTGEGGRGFMGERMNLRMSADGSLMGMWASGLTPSGINAVFLDGAKARFKYQHESAGAIVPSPDGRCLHTANGVYDPDQLQIMIDRGDRPRGRTSVPAYQGQYYVEIASNPAPAAPRSGSSPSENTTVLTIALRGESRPLITLPPLAFPLARAFDQALTLDKRIHLIPAAGVLAIIPDGNDRVILRRFDLMEELRKSDVDYLFVSTAPPITAVRGAAYHYKIVAQSRRGGVKFNLDSGPEGMQLADNGELVWVVPASGAEEAVNVIVRVKDDSGQEVFHTFKIAVK